MNDTGKVDTLNDWFLGNVDAQDLFTRIVFIAHAWDDLVDKDKPVPEGDVNLLMLNSMLHIPMNPFFRKYEAELRAVIFCSMISYMAANQMERSKNEHKVEIAHYLRYAVTQVVVFMLGAIHGVDNAPAIVAEAMVYMMPERLSDYAAEHLGSGA